MRILLRDLREVGVLKAGAKKNYAGLLLLNIDEVEEIIIEDDLNYRGPSFAPASTDHPFRG